MTTPKLVALSWQEKIKRDYSYFAQDDVKAKVDAQVVKTLNWLTRNKGRYTTVGFLESGCSWWNVPSSFTDNPIRIETRSRMLREHAYEHGILHFLRGLEDEGVFSLCPLSIKLVTEATTPGVINNLVNAYHAQGPDANISLAKFGELYCYAPNSRNELIRENKLVPLSSLGILSARFNQSYAISLGPVAQAFHDHVYFPIINTMSINPVSEK